MEEQYRQITNIIGELAAANPYITKEQIAKARSMYNGDMRPLDEIRAELEAYSEEIMEQGRKRDAAKGREIPKDKQMPVPPVQPVEPVRENTPTPEMLEPPVIESDEQTQEQPEEIYEPLRAELPGEKKRQELQNMINDALGDPDQPTVEDTKENNAPNKDMPKVLVKQNTPSNESEGSQSTSEAGYGSIAALLSLTIICSLVTIIIALCTIYAN